MAFLQYLVTLNLTERNFTFDSDLVLAAEISGGRSYTVIDNLEEKFQALPGVEKVAFASQIPGLARPGFTPSEVEGWQDERGGSRASSEASVVSHGYFDFINTPILRGRSFSNTDTPESQPVVVINKFFADEYYPEENPLGRRIKVFNKWHTVIGVVANYQGSEQNALIGKHSVKEIYVSAKQGRFYTMNVLLTGQGNIHQYGLELQKILTSVDARLVVKGEVKTISERLDVRWFFIRLTRDFVIAFGLTALLLACVGLYALVSFSAQQKYRELGIRMALGANKKQILWFIFSQIKWQIVLGIGLGACLIQFLPTYAYGYLPRMHYGTKQTYDLFLAEPLGVSLALLTALIAIILPALKATKVPPNSALRTE